MTGEVGSALVGINVPTGGIGASGLSGFVAGGVTAAPAYTNITEEWTVDAVVTTFTTS